MIFVNLNQAPFVLLLFLLLTGLICTIIIRRYKTLNFLFSKYQQKLVKQNQIKGIGLTKNISLFIAVAMLCLALLDPRGTTLTSDLKLEGIDIVLTFDLSRSMDAEDVKPSRIALAKTLSEQLIDNLVGHRVSVVAFAADATRILPLTTDINAVNLFTRDLSTDMFSSQSTDIGKALIESVKAFSEDSLTHKTIIVFSDGENLDGNTTEALNMIKEKGINVYFIGLGTIEGGTIPVYNNEQQKIGNLTTFGNKEVITKMDTDYLKKLASDAGGRYFERTEILRLANQLNDFEKNPFGTNTQNFLEPKFRIFILIALFSLLLYLFLPEQRIKKTLLFLIFFLSGTPSFTLTAEHSGYANFNKQEYAKSLRFYQRSLIKNPKNDKAKFGEGVALYKLERGERAEQNFLSLTNSENKQLASKAIFNAGNARVTATNLDGALELYKEIMKQEDANSSLYKKALNNYFYVRALQQSQQQQNNEDQEENKDQQQQNNKDQENSDQSEQEQDKESEQEQQGEQKDIGQSEQPSEEGQTPKADVSDIENLLGIAEAEERKNLERQEKGQKTGLLQQNKW